MRFLPIALAGWIFALFTSVRISAATLYVNVNSGNPAPPYSDWSTAATDIQSAVNAANIGDQILVTNGTYQTGGQAVVGSLMSRVVVSKALTVQSVNGPSVTTIVGNQVPGVTNGDGAIRCVYLTNNAVLIGFTLTNGATRGANGSSSERFGGGIYCRSASAVVSNCVIVGNASVSQGGGVFQGTLYNCTLAKNISTNGGGAYSSFLINCTLAGNRAFTSGGGAYSATLTNCTVLTNTVHADGGGVYSSTLTNCTLNGNSANNGGGAYGSTLIGCVLATNTVVSVGGGAYGGVLSGCTLNGNSANSAGGVNAAAATGSALTGNISATYGGGANGGTFTNCTFTSNSALAGNGGGAISATLVNCILMNNRAQSIPGQPTWMVGNGGGAYAGTLKGCALIGNFATIGGGTASGFLYNCTLVDNVAFIRGGGADTATLNNCIVYYNSAAAGPNYNGISTLNYCCTTPLPLSGNGNVVSEPLLADKFHLSSVSPCRNAGNATYAFGKDIDGELWAGPPSIGCDEFNPATAIGSLSATIQSDFTNAAVGALLNFSTTISGIATSNYWDFGDGTVLSNHSEASHAWSAPGDYVVTFKLFNLDYPLGVSTTMTIHVVAQPVHYVAINNPTPVAPYNSWATAATNIQDAINAATIPGARVVVSNGVYAAGGRVVFGALTNRVAVTRPLQLQSVNGPTVTTIKGNPVWGDSAVRCIYLTNGASLSGFTLTNGATRISGDEGAEQAGGAIWCASPSVSISNCIVASSLAYSYGGGTFSGTLGNCQIVSNSSSNSGGGTYFSSMVNCTLLNNAATNDGGGAYGGSLSDSTLIGNTAQNGGAANSSTLINCVVSGNSGSVGAGVYNGLLSSCSLSNNVALSMGGASYNSVLNGCLIIGNQASNNISGTSTAGGGVYGGALTNCVLNNNLAGRLGYGGGADGAVLENCRLTNNFATFIGGATANCTVMDCALISNSTPLAGYVLEGAYVGSQGGAVFIGVASNCLMVGNSSVTGGGAGSATLYNCILNGNYSSTGGGADSSTLNGCAIFNNSASVGGGVNGGTLNNCTVIGNVAAVRGGGAELATLNNCIVYYNSATFAPNCEGGTLNYCCTTPLPASGSGNISNEPLLADSFHLSSISPCRNAGNAVYAGGKDIDNELWAATPSIGCDEFNSSTSVGPLSAAIRADYTNAVVGAPLNLSAVFGGNATANSWDFGDGTILNNLPYVSHAWTTAGNYLITLRLFNNDYPSGVSATLTVHVVSQAVHYVAADSLNPVPPYATWATAATNIQDAINAAIVSGARIIVSNGVYATGGTVVYGALTNRVAVTKPLQVQSVNGPAVTFIQGNSVLGDAAVRCVYLTNGASLAGFTLTNGATRTSGDQNLEQSGAGVWCAAPSVTVSNCVLTGNSSLANGAAAYSGTLNNCSLVSNTGNVGDYSITGEAAYSATLNNCLIATNRANGVNNSILKNCTVIGNLSYGANSSILDHCSLISNGAAGANSSTAHDCLVTDNSGSGLSGCTAYDCMIVSNRSSVGGGAGNSQLARCSLIGNVATAGGGAASCGLNACIVSGNISYAQGGGAVNCGLTNCIITGNSAGSDSGAASGCTLVNCTVVSNSAAGSPAGVYSGAIDNSIVYYNLRINGAQTNLDNFSNATVNTSCTVPLPAGGANNFTNPPLFVDLAAANFRLQSNSPCIDAGKNLYVVAGTDLDGRPRFVGGIVDVGAYEYQDATNAAFVAWLGGYGLPMDGTSDYADPDRDGLNNWQEWIAGTDPTNVLSALKMSPLSKSAPGLSVTWQSIPSRTYFLQRSTNINATPAFSSLQSNIVGQVSTTTFIDTTATNSVPYYYRVGIQQ